MPYSNSTRTAVEVVFELIDELQHTNCQVQVIESCREVLRLTANVESLSGQPNASIVMLCREKTLTNWAMSVAILLRSATKAAQEVGTASEVFQLTTAEGMMWGVVAMLNIEEIKSRGSHPSRSDLPFAT